MPFGAFFSVWNPCTKRTINVVLDEYSIEKAKHAMVCTSMVGSAISFKCMFIDQFMVLAKTCRQYLLPCCRLDDAMLCMFARAIQGNQSIEAIDVSCNLFGPVGMKSLANAMTTCNVIWLDLDNNNLTDEGFEMVSNLLTIKTSLMVVKVSWCLLSASVVPLSFPLIGRIYGLMNNNAIFERIVDDRKSLPVEVSEWLFNCHYRLMGNVFDDVEIIPYVNSFYVQNNDRVRIDTIYIRGPVPSSTDLLTYIGRNSHVKQLTLIECGINSINA